MEEERVWDMRVVFTGANDITHHRAKRVREIEYQKKYELAYLEDLKTYGGELTLENANEKLLSLGRTKSLVLKLWAITQSNEAPTGLDMREARLMRKIAKWPHRPFSKEVLLKLNRALLVAEDVDKEILIENPFELGEIAQILYAEKHPTVRLWLHFKEYLISVVPDGITDSYVYEFKATIQKGQRYERLKEDAIRQAALYACAFRRPNIKVQVARFRLSMYSFPLRVKDLPKPQIVEISRPASHQEALVILSNFDEDFRGNDARG